MSARRLIIILVGLSCLMPDSTMGQTLSSRKVLGRYQQYLWQDQHGLPQNAVSSIVRTRDGYLWLGTVEGAVRFDGVRFTVFDSNNTGEIRSSQITALLEDRAGNLWMGTNVGGLNRYRDGHFTLYTTQEGLSNDQIRCLFEDRAGNLWIGTYGGGLNRFGDGRFSVWTTRDGLPHDQVWAITEDREGSLWIGTGNGLARFKDGRFTVFTARDGLAQSGVYSLCLDREGNLWAGSGHGALSRFKDGRFTVYGSREGLPRDLVTAITEDRAGVIWIGTRGSGLCRFKDGRFTSYTTKDGLPSDRILSIYQDPDGDLWVGTDGSGLCQFRDGRFKVYTEADGLPRDFTLAIYEDTAGGLWVSTVGGLSRFKDGAFTVYTTRDGLLSNIVRSICEDREGSLWFGTGAGVSRYKDGRFTNWTTKEGLSEGSVYPVLADRAGNVWIGALNGGLNRFRDGRFTVLTTRDGLADNSVLSLYEDRSGSLWIGTLNGGVSRFKDEHFTTWTTKDGLGSNHVLSFFEDRTGALWIGTHGGGLSRLKDEKLTTITARDGLYDNLAFQILLDAENDDGNLWMSCNKGIYRASLKELNDFADGRVARVTSFAYGVADGMLSRECNGAHPAGWKTRDGRLWFPTVKGLVVIDPQSRDLQPPLVAIEEVMLDRVAQPAGQLVRIGPGRGNLEIQYTGLSWSRPAQIKFRYQLVGLDEAWVEAGTRRTAYYPHLPPGEYTFKVIADNGEGVWNTEGKELRIIVLPPFYRTWWFLTLAAISVAGMALLGYRYRIAQLRRAQAAQQAFSRQLITSQEQERKRIAAELHDSLGQRLVVIKNLALMFLRAPSNKGDRGGQTTARQQIEEISAEASLAIGEVKEISYNLRPYQLDRIGLTKAVLSVVKKAAAASEIAFSAEIDDLDGVFPEDSEINFYRIVQESVNNILKHSQATEASVTIRREADRILLTIRDNGKGFTPGAANPDSREDGDGQSGFSQGGFGLIGISERAQLLGGKLVIHSVPGSGTTINMAID
jgi:ligand-binding sensor domain-containing protein/signal transduction histidine kinase